MIHKFLIVIPVTVDTETATDVSEHALMYKAKTAAISTIQHFVFETLTPKFGKGKLPSVIIPYNTNRKEDIILFDKASLVIDLSQINP